MALKDTWRDWVDGETEIHAEDINGIAHSVIENEERIGELDKVALRTVNLTKVAKATDGTAEITENSITPLTMSSGVGFIAGIIDISGYVEIEAENTRADSATLIINGERYVTGTGYDKSISFKGKVNGAIGFEIEALAKLTFTKFVTTTDYELHNKVSEIDEKVSDLEDVCLENADLVEITTVGFGNAEVTSDTITCLDDIGYTINVTGYVEIEATTRYEDYGLTINDVLYTGNISFKGVVTKPITGATTLPGDYVKFSNFKVSRIDALEKQVGDFDAALDELHAYAQALIGGATV